jgi:hypothetical protein
MAPPLTTTRHYIGSLIPGVHPAYRAVSFPEATIQNMFVYLASWCAIREIAIEKAWVHNDVCSFLCEVSTNNINKISLVFQFHCKGRRSRARGCREVPGPALERNHVRILAKCVAQRDVVLFLSMCFAREILSERE